MGEDDTVPITIAWRQVVGTRMPRPPDIDVESSMNDWESFVSRYGIDSNINNVHLFYNVHLAYEDIEKFKSETYIETTYYTEWMVSNKIQTRFKSHQPLLLTATPDLEEYYAIKQDRYTSFLPLSKE